jgi:K+-transporting ATPase KdpF subunit
MTFEYALTGLIALALGIYLFSALLRPERL